MSIYHFTVKKSSGEEIPLSQFKGKVLIIVNTASQCGLTHQYAELQKLHAEYENKGLQILAFPCNQFAGQEPGSNSQIQQFCQLSYGTTFPIFAKTEVRGEKAHPLFKYLVEQAPCNTKPNPLAEKNEGQLKTPLLDLLCGDSIKWNFTKFLVDKEGNIAGRYEPPTTPLSMVPDIEKLL